MPTKYRIRNWNVYNKSLRERGNITVWLDEASLESWRANVEDGKHGAQFTYSDIAIELSLTLRAIYHLPLRQTEGFIQGLFQLASIELPVPCYTTMSRRAKSLAIELPRTEDPLHLVVDSTGLKIYGEGEWKVRNHGVGKRRTWRKLHLGVNPKNHEIISAVVTSNDVHDSQVMEDLIESEVSAKTVVADGAYDSSSCYNEVVEIDALPLIPPRRGARIAQHGNCKRSPLPRDENIRGIRSLGRSAWKKKSGYHCRSLAETAMFRIKTIFGDKIPSRVFENQATEALLRCRLLNIMSTMGMPQTEAIEI